MKTYSTSEKAGRLAAYLVATAHPFNFDGWRIEFTASITYVERMQAEDKALASIDFIIK